MRTPRRTLILAVVALAALTAAGCGRGEGAAGGPSGTKDATLIMRTLNNPFFVSVADGAKAQAAGAGLNLSVQNANNSDQSALDLTTTSLAKKPAVLIIDPVGSQSGTAMTKAANAAGVPVMAFDRRPDSGNLATFIGYDAVQAGKNAAASLGEALGGKGKVVEIQGILGTNVAQDRSKGFRAGIAAFPDIQVVATQAADFDRGKALNVMTNVLQANPNIDGVYAANDEMALGVVAALSAQGKAGTVKVVGNDGIADAIAAVSAGTMYSTNAESPYALGQEVVKLASSVAKGEQVAAEKVLQGKLVKKADVSSYCQYLTSIGDTKGCPAG